MCAQQMIKYCTKMETAIKLNFTMIKLISKVFVNVTRKWKEKNCATFAFIKLF